MLDKAHGPRLMQQLQKHRSQNLHCFCNYNDDAHDDGDDADDDDDDDDDDDAGDDDDEIILKRCDNVKHSKVETKH